MNLVTGRIHRDVENPMRLCDASPVRLGP